MAAYNCYRCTLPFCLTCDGGGDYPVGGSEVYCADCLPEVTAEVEEAAKAGLTTESEVR